MFASGKTAAVASAANYIEDVFSTYLYTGTSASQTITNGIDLSTYGGLVVIKGRSTPTGSSAYGGAANQFTWQDTVRGITQTICSNRTDAQLSAGGFASNSSISTSGFTLDYNGYNDYNRSPNTYASWTFRKQPKFFDVVTYTGDGVNGRAISHNLGSVPGCMIIKKTSAAEQWAVYHRSTGNTQYGMLDQTNAFDTFSGAWNNTTPTDTVFTVGNWAKVNESGQTYVAYLFAHNAGGFGTSGTDNVISCGSFTTDSGGNATVSLGYEPAWVMFKCSSNAGQNWEMIDTMRGWSMSTDVSLQANSAAAEASGGFGNPTATGFVMGGQGNTQTYIYIAIRRGPMKVPTSGTSVLQTLTYTGNGSSGRIYSGVTTVPDLAIATSRSNTSPKNWCDRLRGENPMISTSTDGESGTSQEGKTIIAGSANGTVTFGSYWGDAAVNTNGYTYVNYLLSRAPSFFDEVCYTGTGSQQNITHNLGVAPELMIVKRRSAAGGSWATWATSLTADQSLALNTTDDKTAVFSVGFWGSTYPTSSVFTVGSNVNTNSNTVTYVAYLFATCAGVSKVFSYTGNGSSQTINCGFTGGARWILIKRTDSTGDWYVWDSARGIVSGNDPHLSLNTTAAEVTTDDTIDTDSTGFVVNQVSATNVNVSSATYIGFAVA